MQPFFSLPEAPATSTGATTPVTDAFLAAHIAPSPAATAPAQPATTPAQSKNAIPLDDQIHPLIRARRLETPEEIAIWIAERRSRYPTAANIRRKQLEQQEQEQERQAKRKRTSNDNPLAALLTAYGSDDTGSSNAESSDSDAPPDRAPLKQHVRQTPLPSTDTRAARTSAPTPAPPAASAAPATSLLHRLLAKDIDRENRRILQCIQHILSTGQPSSTC
ncbi:hypothetical protein IW150_004158 [Coemansia sp. RSA 2607]|nr:hypothetical protein IW150_004158 [Coemansia sp. RSA 2607]